MKNIAICYSEHAIKVSDSYCSGPSNHALKPPHSAASAAASIQTAVTSVYKVKLSSEKQFLIRISWCNPLSQSFSVAISDYPFAAAKLSRSFKALRRQRGSESLNSGGGLTADVHWDLRRARYESGPEPVAGFHVAVTVNSELALVLGDREAEWLPESEPSLISRGERLSGGGGVYSARARFSEGGASHDVVIKVIGEDGTTSSRGRLLCVYVDKKMVIEVKRLQWNFRGNQSIFLDGLLIDLMWDVHDWIFNSSSNSGYAVFLFRTRRGFDSRLWLEETNFDQEKEKVAFSFLIFASKNPD